MIDLSRATEISGFHTLEGEYLRVIADEKGFAHFEHFTVSGAVKVIEGGLDEMMNLLEGARESIFGGCLHPDNCQSPDCACGPEPDAQAADPAPTTLETL